MTLRSSRRGGNEECGQSQRGGWPGCGKGRRKVGGAVFEPWRRERRRVRRAALELRRRAEIDRAPNALCADETRAPQSDRSEVGDDAVNGLEASARPQGMPQNARNTGSSSPMACQEPACHTCSAWYTLAASGKSIPKSSASGSCLNW